MTYASSRSKNQPVCDLYLAPLKTRPTDGFRTAVYAGRNIKQAELLEIANTVIVKREMIEEWQMYDYTFDTESNDHEMHLFGIAMLLAHNHQGNVYHFWTSDFEVSDVPLTPPNPYSDYDKVSFYAESPISRGDELVLSVEDTDFEIEAGESDEEKYTPYTVDELHSIGHCLTNVFVAESDISQAGEGLFTKEFVKKGDIVTISPVMVLPRHKVEKQNMNSLLINYCISRNDSDIALLPVGLAGMINHNDGVNGDVANLRMEWHSWKFHGGRAKTRWEPDALENAPFPPLYIKYIAERDIYAGEELTISYGRDWEEAWKSYDEESRSIECPADEPRQEAVQNLDIPQFRHFINAPDGLFPPNFVSTCIGKNKNDCGLLEAKRRMSFDDDLLNKFNRGPELVAAYRDKIHSRKPNPELESKSCGRVKKEMPLVFSNRDPNLDPSDEQ